MRRRVIGVLATVVLMLDPSAKAQIGIGIATETTQILNHGQLVMQYIRQGQQLTNEVNMLADMVRNGKRLPAQTFGPITADLNALAAIVKGGQALAYSLTNLDARFRSTFQGYGALPNSYYPKYQNWAKTSLDTTLGALRAAGLQGQQMAGEQFVLNNLRATAATSDGRMQALQVMGQISEQQVQQLMKLREIMLADMSSKQAYQAALIQQQAASEAATEKFFNAGPASGDGRKFRPGLN